MKKLLTLGLCLVSLVAFGQRSVDSQFNSFSLMNAKGLTITNLMGITNLNCSAGAGTNVVGTVFTNIFGTKVTTTASVSDKYNLLTDFDIPSTALCATNSNYPLVLGTIYVEFSRAGASATNALDFIFYALPDGVNEVTGTWGTVALSVPADAAATTPVKVQMPLHSTEFLGCRKVRLGSVGYTATAAGDSRLTVTKLSFNGFY